MTFKKRPLSHGITLGNHAVLKCLQCVQIIIKMKNKTVVYEFIYTAFWQMNYMKYRTNKGKQYFKGVLKLEILYSCIPLFFLGSSGKVKSFESNLVAKLLDLVES